MEKPSRPTGDYLREMGWAFLLFNGMAGGAGVLVGVHLDSVGLGLAVFLGASITVTLLLAILIAGTIGWDALARRLARRAGRRA